MDFLIKGILAGALIGHFISYKEYYIRILVTFVVTYVMKRVMIGSGEKLKGDLIGAGGYCLTASEIFSLMNALVKNARG